MKRCWWLLILIALTIVGLQGAEASAVKAVENKDPFFKLAERDFSFAEAQRIAGLSPEIKDMQAAVRANFAAAAAIVLCSRNQIELSAGRTRNMLADGLLLMGEKYRRQLEGMLAGEQQTIEQYLDRESQQLTNQLNEAVRSWYEKNFASAGELKSEYVQNWYYRHQDLFRRVKVEPAAVLVFAAGADAEIARAQAALRQGMPIEQVCKSMAVNTAVAEHLDELQAAYSGRIKLHDGLLRINGSKHVFICRKDALKSFYLPLDDKLKSAIKNMLAEALAKAQLAEELKHTFAAGSLIFY